MTIYADNNGSISHSLYNKNHQWTKHINIKHHFVKDQVKQGNITFKYVPSSDNVADILTKPLPRNKVHSFAVQLNLNYKPKSASDQGECWNDPMCTSET